MGEIVYYDANPTVRDLLARKFTKYGLHVSLVPSLKQCEEVLKKCRKPLIFIADLSRHPDYLPMLQAIVPRYIDAPERCILTSIKPRELAPFLLPNLEDNFFTHVVERPFKTEEFMNFFDDVAKLCPNTTCFVHDQHVSCVNSSVEQITGQNSFVVVDDALASEVDEIFKTTTGNSTSGSNTQSRPQNRMNQRDARPLSKNSRLREAPVRDTVSPVRDTVSPVRDTISPVRDTVSPVRDAASFDNRRNQPQRIRHVVPGRDMPAPNRDMPVLGRNTALPKRDVASKGGLPNPIAQKTISPKAMPGSGTTNPQYGRDNELPPQIPQSKIYEDEDEVSDMTQAIMPEDLSKAGMLFNDSMTTDNQVLPSGNVSKSSLDAAGISAMRGFKLSKREPPVPKLMTVASTFEAPMSDAENAFGDHTPSGSKEEEEIEGSSTMFFTMPPEAFSMPQNDSANNIGYVESSIVPDEVTVHYAFDIPWIISILRMSLVRQKRYTVVCSKDSQDQIVILIASGRVEWIERIRKGVLPDVHAFLETLPPEIVPRQKITSWLKKKASVREIFNAPEFIPLASAVSQMITRQMPDILRYFDGCPADVLANIPAKWAALGVDRPCIDFKFPHILFDFLRTDAESVLTPECFPYARFGARQFRTPLNADIALNVEEKELLLRIQMPKTIAELKANGQKHVSDILYRLVGFEFADIVY